VSSFVKILRILKEFWRLLFRCENQALVHCHSFIQQFGLGREYVW